jgi:lipoprotein-anchoring transpeptidase ErfK/SrfK
MRGVTPAAAVCSLAAAVAAACGGAVKDRAVRATPIPTPVVQRAPSCRAGSMRRLVSHRSAYAAVVRVSAQAYRSPGRRSFASFTRLNVNGVPNAFSVLHEVVDARCRPTWYHVRLPLRPNGVTGYVDARDVDLARVRTRIVIDLSARRVTLYRAGRKVLASAAAIGAAATPTPAGRYYVNQKLIPADAGGPYGPGAIGISAFSPVLTGWAQGGPIAIHGTNAPWSIGHAVSNGCVRVPNPVLRRLFNAALVGTPVVIKA